jgi:hypothetical protein
MMQQMLDKMNGFEAWKMTTDASLRSLLTKMTEVVTRINHLEKAPPPPPPPPPLPPPVSWIPGGIDLNAIPSPGGPSSSAPGELPQANPSAD